MTLPLDLSIYFSGAQLTYSATGLPEGLDIDPATGVVTGAFVKAASSTVTVTASNAAGEAVGAFDWLVEAAVVIEAPQNSAAPSLTGNPEVGETLNADPGTWTGGPDFAFQWLRNGAPIAGATDGAYLLAASDDMARIAVRVTATNSTGSAVATSADALIRYRAPSSGGALQDQAFNMGAGAQTVNAAADFSGASGGEWSVSGAGATIDQAGVVTIPTDAPLADAVVTVGYSNSGGSASSVFSITVSAAPTSITVDSASLRFPVANVMGEVADMSYVEVPDLAPTFRDKLWTGDGAFILSASIPTQSWSTTSSNWNKHSQFICGNGGGGGGNNRSFSCLVDPANDSDVAGPKLRIKINAAVSHDFDIGGARDLLIVARQVGAELFLEIYQNGAITHSAAFPAFSAERFREGFKIGVGGRGGAGDPYVVSGQGGFDGSVGLFGYVDGTVTQAQCAAISLGADPATEITDWYYGVKLDDPANATPFKDVDDRGDLTFVGSGFRKGGDILPAHAGATWFKLDPVYEGHVWSVEPGASTGAITLSGQASGLTGTVEARYFDADGTVRKDWTELAGSAISGGVWEGSMTAPLGKGWGHVEARPKSTPAMVQRSRAECGVGYDIFALGQSQLSRCFSFTDLGLTPPAGAAVSVTRNILRRVLAQTPVSPDRPVADGVAAAAGYLAAATDAPVRIVDLAESGTGLKGLMDDSDAGRDWADLAETIGLAKPSSGVTVMQWGTSQLGSSDHAGRYLDPLWKGLAPTGSNYAVDHYLKDGTMPASSIFAISPVTPHFSKSTPGPVSANPEGVAVQGANAYDANLQMEAWCDVEAFVYGPEMPGVMLEPNGHTHQDPTTVYGHPRTLIRVVETGLRALGGSSATDPTLGTAVRSGAAITIPATLPNGGTLQTAWAIAGVSVPAGWTTVQGFEVSEDGGATWSNGAAAASASPEFSAEIVAGEVVLTSSTGTWPANTHWRYAAYGPLNYGESTKALRLQHGLLYEGDGDGLGPVAQLASEGGIGLPVRAKEGVAA